MQSMSVAIANIYVLLSQEKNNMSFVGSNLELIRDYTASSRRTDDVLFFLGKPEDQASIAKRHMDEFKKIVYQLAVRGYVCENAKMSGENGVHPAILRVVERHGVLNEDNRPASLSGLAVALSAITTYPVIETVVEAPDCYYTRLEGINFVKNEDRKFFEQKIVYVDIEGQ